MCIIDKKDFYKAQLEAYKKYGIQEGIQEGKKSNQVATIKAMYEKDFNVELIASIVDLDVIEVKNILQLN